MAEHDQALVESLCNENSRFRKLYEEHQIFKKQLADLDQKPHLNAEQEVERKKIQKLKLVGKDEMEVILRGQKP